VLGAALVMGGVGDALFRSTPWGLNVPAWIALLLVASWVIARRHQLALTGEGRWLLPPALFFAGAIAWRDSTTLATLNGLALLVALSLAALHARSGQIRRAGVTEYLLGVCLVGLHALTGIFLLLFADVKWKELPRGRGSEAAFAVGRGVLIALPLLLLFGGLFVSADAEFERIVTRLFHWDMEELITHLFVIGVCACAVGGVLRLALGVEDSPNLAAGARRPSGAGGTEVAVVLSLLNALFLAFVLIQVRYFFGGAALVMATRGLTCADYARRGFFELVTVTALVLPVLLFAHWLLPKEGIGHQRIFRGLAGSLVLILFVIMASAMQRMLLYYQSYGLTELRFYTTAFMSWLAVLFVWFLVTVLRGRRERFAFGALVTTFAGIALLDRVNPDGWIVQANIARVAAGRSFDEAYITALSADAVPALVEGLPALSESKRRAVASAVLSRWAAPVPQDWRTWNWSRSQARRMVRAGSAAVRVEGEARRITRLE
jgi:hypothetical protein